MKTLKCRFIVIALVALAISGCVSANTDRTEIVIFPPSAHIISVVPSNSYTGDKVTFSGEGVSTGNIKAYKWTSALDGLLSDQATFSTESLSEGKHKIFFSVQDDNGTWSGIDTAVVIVSAPVPVPVIDYFRSEPYQIGLTENSTLTWHVSGANGVSIDNGIGTVSEFGRVSVSPAISTRYIITASNEGGTISEYIDVLVVPISNFNLPSIRIFAADSPSIAKGDQAKLIWEVDYADAVQIDPDIGLKGPSGSALIAPAVTTKYTLTAYNSIGIIVGTTQIVVGSEPGTGRPDLALTDIYKVVTPDGVKIGYSLENQGTGSAPATESKLYANGAYKDVISLPVIPAGSRIESLFENWNYDPSVNIIQIDIDAGNNVIESDKSNNSLLMKFPVIVDYDFFTNAPLAQWGNGFQQIPFGGRPDNIDGAALYRTDKRLENASGPDKYLETRPRATFAGFITGDYLSALQVKPGNYVNAIVGLLEGSDAGNVVFTVYIRETGDAEWTLLGDGVTSIYDYKLHIIDLAVPPAFYGKNVDFRLKVENTSEPLQNWAVWVHARVIR